MEEFGARKSAPLETCLNEVKRCDIYVGIIAFRYGSIEEEARKSITRLEYETAVDFNKEKLSYLFNENGLLQPKYVDYGDERIHLEDFKSILKRFHTIDKFSDKDELAEKVYNRLNELLKDIESDILHNGLPTNIFKFQVKKRKWIAFVSFLNDNPFEILTGFEEDFYSQFPISKSITTGRLLKYKNKDEGINYTFKYRDKRGFSVSLGGLNGIFDSQIQDNSGIISKLLQEDVPIQTIFEELNKIDSSNFVHYEHWKIAINKIFQKM